MIKIVNENNDIFDINFDDVYNEGLQADVQGVAKDLEQNLQDFRNAVGSKNATLKTISDITSVLPSNTVSKRTSIVAKAKNSLFLFPVYIDRGINIDVARTVSEAFGRVYASFSQIAISQNMIQTDSDLNNLAFLKQIHTNMNESVKPLIYNEYYEPIDDFDQTMIESIKNTIKVNDKLTIEFAYIDNCHPLILNECKRLSHDSLDGFNFLKEAPEVPKYKVTSKKTDTRINKSDNVLSDADLQHVKIADNDKGKIKPIKTNREFINAVDNNKVTYNGREVARRGSEFYIPGFSKLVTTTSELDDDDKIKKDKAEADRKDTVNKIENLNVPKILKDSDVKKINDMVPYTFDANFLVKIRNSEGNSSGNFANVHYIIAVKCVLHPVDAKDLVSELKGIIMGNNKSLQKVRYKTGEISFWKDYIFNLKGLKSDAVRSMDSSKKWVNTLKRLADYGRIYGTVFDKPAETISGSIPIPNATLVLTQQTVSLAKNETGIDLTEIAMAKKLCDSLFLLSFAIHDATARTMKVLTPDEKMSWNVQSLDALEAELNKTNTANVAKELNKYIAK